MRSVGHIFSSNPPLILLFLFLLSFLSAGIVSTWAAITPPAPPLPDAPNATPPGKAPLHKVKGRHIIIQHKNDSLALEPGVPSHDPRTFPKNAGPTEFELAKVGGRLVLRYVSKNRRLQLATNRTLVVQFQPDISYTITPNIITNSQWPKNFTEVAVGITGPLIKNGALIRGKASYSYCEAGTQKCSRAFSHITYFYHP